LKNSSKHAAQLAAITHDLKNKTVLPLLSNKNNHIAQLFQDFQETDFPRLSKEEFADQYTLALTTLYLSAMSLSSSNDWRKVKKTIFSLVQYHKQHHLDNNRKPRQIYRILKSLLLNRIPASFKDCLDKIAVSLEMGHGQAENPNRGIEKYFEILSFYQMFLSCYNQRMATKNGIFFTPLAVTSFMVRSLHTVLTEKMDKCEGLTDRRVTVMDPAAGTSVFMLTAADLISKEFFKSKGNDLGKAYIRHFLTNNLCGTEKVLPLYVLSFVNFIHYLKTVGIPLKEDERLHICWEDVFLKEKIGIPFTAIIGNPPYSSSTSGKQDWIIEQIQEHYNIDAKGEPKRPLDDYIKFIRLAQWKMDRQEKGVVVFITGNSYLYEPEYLEMRKSLTKSFHEIYVVNLSGNGMEELCNNRQLTDRKQSDTVPGTTISIFIKNSGKQPCGVFYTDVRGTLEEKLLYLHSVEFNQIPWQQVYLAPSTYQFLPMESNLSTTIF